MMASRAFGGTLMRSGFGLPIERASPGAEAGLADGGAVLVVEGDDDAGQLLGVLAGANVAAADPEPRAAIGRPCGHRRRSPATPGCRGPAWCS